MNSQVLNAGRKVVAGVFLLALLIVLVKNVTAESKCSPLEKKTAPIQEIKREFGRADRDQPWTMAGLLVI